MPLYLFVIKEGTLRDADTSSMATLRAGTKVEAVLPIVREDMKPEGAFFTHKFLRVYVCEGPQKGEIGFFMESKLARPAQIETSPDTTTLRAANVNAEVITLKQRYGRQFVETIDLPDYDAGLRHLLFGQKSEIKDNEKSANVVAGMLTSFVSGISAMHKRDVLNSVLLAQLAANKKFDREADVENWYSFYREVLENVGWVIQDFDFSKYEASGHTFTVDNVVLDVLGAIAVGNELAVAKAAISALGKLGSNDGPVMLWDSSTSKAGFGTFQISTCTEDDGNVVMKNGAFHLQTEERFDRILFFSFSSSRASIYKAGQTMTLNDSIYSGVRKTVETKLGDRATTFVEDLEI